MIEQPEPSSPPAGAPPREGDPLEGLWHWTDHPVARLGIVIAVLAGVLVLFPLLAQAAF